MAAQSFTLTKAQLDRVGVLQRRMMRRIVGWRRLPTDTWADTMKRMNTRLHAIQEKCPVLSWTARLAGRRWDVAMQALQLPAESWTLQALHWKPSLDVSLAAHRERGRPANRWDDSLLTFCKTYFSTHSWLQASTVSNNTSLAQAKDAYILYCHS